MGRHRTVGLSTRKRAINWNMRAFAHLLAQISLFYYIKFLAVCCFFADGLPGRIHTADMVGIIMDGAAGELMSLEF